MNDLSDKLFKLDYAFSIDELYAFITHCPEAEKLDCLYDFYLYVRDLIFVLESHLTLDEIPDLGISTENDRQF